MKKTALILVLAIFVGIFCFSPCAGADSYLSNSAKEFAFAMDGDGITYTYNGSDSGQDWFTIKYTTDYFNPLNVDFYFVPDDSAVFTYCWNVLSFEAEKAAEVKDIVNRLNGENYFVTYYYDESDNSLTISSENWLGGNVGVVCSRVADALTRGADAAYEALESLCK